MTIIKANLRVKEAKVSPSKSSQSKSSVLVYDLVFWLCMFCSLWGFSWYLGCSSCFVVCLGVLDQPCGWYPFVPPFTPLFESLKPLLTIQKKGASFKAQFDPELSHHFSKILNLKISICSTRNVTTKSDGII